MQRVCSLSLGFQEKLLQETKFHALRFQQTHPLHEVLQMRHSPCQWRSVSLLPYQLDCCSYLTAHQQIPSIWNLRRGKCPCFVTSIAYVHFLRLQKYLLLAILIFDRRQDQHLPWQREQVPIYMHLLMDLPFPRPKIQCRKLLDILLRQQRIC